MKIEKGQKLEFKASSGRWKEVIAREDFNTNDDIVKKRQSRERTFRGFARE